MGHHLFNPFSPCCCADGTICLKVEVCAGEAARVVITDDATGEVVADYDSRSPFLGSDCTTLPGDRDYTITISKDHFVTQVLHHSAPCASTPWTYDQTVILDTAEGYICPCFGFGCTEPIKLPFTVNDGLGDATMAPAGVGGISYSACAERPTTGSDDCCTPIFDPYGVELPTPLVAITTPIGFSWAGPLGGCDVGGPEVLLWCDAIIDTPYGQSFKRVATQASCGDEPCSFDQINTPDEGCGNATPVGPPRVTCSPFTIEQDFTLHGCLVDVYGATVTITVSEAP